MKKSLIALLGLLWPVLAQAQVIDDCGAGGLEPIGFDDGVAESCWRITGGDDWFSVDFDVTAANREILGVYVMTCETATGGLIGELGVYPDNLAIDPTGATPDVSNPISNLVNPTGLPGTFCNEFIPYDTPDVELLSTSIHVAFQLKSGDDAVSLCADSDSGGVGRSYFTSDGFSTPADSAPLNWMLRLAVRPTFAVDGTLTIDGGFSSVARQLDQVVSVTLWGPTALTPWVIFIDASGVGSGPYFGPIPPILLFTGNGPGETAGTACTTLPCAVPSCLNVGFLAIYADFTDLKPNGNPKIKLSNNCNVQVTGHPDCVASCYGQRDDGILDTTILKVQNPAGSSDFFSVKLGAPCAPINFDGVDVASWDTGGAGGSWARVGLYPANLTLDSTGGTPDVNNPATEITGGLVPANQSDWSYPATFYDTPDATANSTTIYHAAVQWPNSDQVLWVGADSDGLDGTCDLFGSTYFTVDGYTTPAIQLNTQNAMIKLRWN